jgi:TonB family protein
MTETALLNLAAWTLQAAALTLAAAALAWVVRIDAPRVRYAWWRIVLVGCLALPVLQPWQPRAELAPAAAVEEEPVTVSESPVPVVPAAEPPGAVGPALPGWRPVAASLLGAGALLKLAWLAAGLVRLRRIRQRGTPARLASDDGLQQALLDAGADVRYVPSLRQPVTFGVVRPVVLLPETLAAMPDGVRRAVFAHELWHVRRRDWLWSLAEEVLRSVLWFNPAIWYLVSRVQSAREEVVDELSIRSTNARRSYLEALLAFADEPAAYPASPFIRRRQLFNRMMLITREGVMSSKRIVASCAGMTGALVLVGWYSGLAFPLTAEGAMLPASASAQQPRDPRPTDVTPATSREAELAAATIADPSNLKNWIDLAKLQEDRRAYDEAEQTLKNALAETSGSREAGMALAGFYNRQGAFEKTMAVLEDLAARNPNDPFGHQLVATYYWEKAQKDQRLTPADKLHYIESGISATDRAIALNADYIEALTYKNILLRMKGNMETNLAARQQLFAEADTLRNRAMELSKARVGGGMARPSSLGAGAPPPPPPPPPDPATHRQVDGVQAVRIGGNIKTPAKIRHVNPVYPQEARDNGISGLVIIEVLIDPQGDVRSTHVLRSIPALDQAALDAVNQWRFEPTILDGAAVPVLMTVTVNFTLQ